jgi:N-acetylglucosamine kinase-like BadF-type ATPase
MKLFLGVDGGQSSTTALIGDETGRVLGMGRGGPCNHAGIAEGYARFRRAIAEAVGAAVKQADVTAGHFECACFGFSGGPADKDALTRELVSAEKYAITHDALIALVGATAGEPGVVTIAGTGSMAFGRNAEGRAARAGGWGFAFGDEGGAFDLVRQALRAVVRNAEGWGPATALRDVLLEATGARDAHDMLHRVYTDDYPRARVASFATLVDQVAVAGDPVAREIVGGAAQALATFALAVRAQLFAPGELVCASYVGGVFQSALVLERFRILMELGEGTRVAAPLYGPAAGALIEAYRWGGVDCALKDPPQEK